MIFPKEDNQQHIPMSYLLNLQLLQREREERHGERFVMDSSRMTMADKSLPNMGTGLVHWMISDSCLSQKSLLLHLPVTNHIYHTASCNIYGKVTARQYRVNQSLNWRHVIMTCLTWRTLQSKVSILPFNQHFNMPWIGRRKIIDENWFKLF